jgi:WD40 repeat protein
MDSPPFVGRDAELTTLQELWADVLVCEPHFLVLVGDAGIGKTGLLQAFYGWLSGELSADEHRYWPDRLAIAEHSSAVTPAPTPSTAGIGGYQQRIPWLWWGLSFRDERDSAESPITSGCGLLTARDALKPHLDAWVHRASRGGLALDTSSPLWSDMAVLADALADLLPLLGVDPVAYASRMAPADIARLLTLRLEQRAHKGADHQTTNDRPSLAGALIAALRAFHRSATADGEAQGQTLPFVLVLDDAQWADSDTLGFVTDLYAEALANRWPLLVLCTHAAKGWGQAKQGACADDHHRGPTTLAEVCLCICKDWEKAAGRSAQPCCQSTEVVEPPSGKCVPVFGASIPSDLNDRWHQGLCQEYMLGPIGVSDLRQVLKRAIPGISGVHSKKIMRRIGDSTAFLTEFIDYVQHEMRHFVNDDPGLGFSESGIERILETIAHGRTGLIDLRFSDLSPKIQALLGHASFQGMRFLKNLLLETGRQLDAGFTQIHLTATMADAVIRELTDDIGAFSAHAWFERGLRWQKDREQQARLRKTVLQCLTEWHAEQELATLPPPARYDALRLFERELTRMLQTPDAWEERYLSLEQVLTEREQLELDLGLPARAAATTHRRAQVPDLMEKAEAAASRRGQVPTGHHGGISAIVWDPRERWVATGGIDGGDIFVWSVATGRPLCRIQTEYGAVRQLAVSPDGRSLVGIFENSKDVCVWNRATGKLRYRLAQHRSPVRAIIVDEEGEWLMSASGRRIVVADLQAGERLLFGGFYWIVRWIREAHLAFRDLALVPSSGFIAVLSNGGISLGSISSAVRRHLGISPLLRFADRQRTLAASGDGRWLAWAAKETVYLLDLNGPRYRWPLRKHYREPPKQPARPWRPGRRTVYGLGFCSNEGWLAASSDGVVELFSIPQGRLLREIDGDWVHHDHWGTGFAVSPAGDWIATAGKDGKVRLLDPADTRPARQLPGQRDWVYVLAASPSGRLLAGGGADSSLSVWDTTTGGERFRTPVHRRPILDLAMAPDGTWIASVGREGAVRLWSTDHAEQATNRQAKMLDLAADQSVEPIEALAVSPAGDWLAIGKVGSPVVIWRPDDEHAQATEIPFFGSKTLIAPSGSSRLVTAEGTGIQRWDISATNVALSSRHTVDAAQMHYEALATDPAGRWVVAGGRLASDHPNQAALWLFDLENGQGHCLMRGIGSVPASTALDAPKRPLSDWLQTRLKVKHRRAGAMHTVSFAGDGRWFAAAGQSGKLWVWDMEGLRLRHFLVHRAQQAPVYALAAALDGTWLASAGKDGMIRFWDIETRQQRPPVVASIRPIRALTVDPKGRWLFSAGDDGLIRRWPLADGLKTEPTCDLAMEPLPDGAWVVWAYPDDERKRRALAQSAGADRWLTATADID